MTDITPEDVLDVLPHARDEFDVAPDDLERVLRRSRLMPWRARSRG
ncbi:MAG TPA: hypothetical protein VFN48_09780 [Solirubrobacteraceae bacterium]|nr:hypothetical protein [Solirubrobacteraceae bacterium]